VNAPEAIWSFLVATLLGLLIGLERERKRELRGSIFAGVRTFPLIALFGAVLGGLHEVTGPLLITAGLLALGGLLGLAYWLTSQGEKVGGTSEIAALVTYGLGVVAGLGHFVVALAGSVIVTGVLSLRTELRTLVGSLTSEDLYAVVQFAAVSLVVLPLVPDRTYGPWGVWNPRTIWLLVVLISGVSFVGYVASKLLGTKRGLSLSGLLGGLASSTAVTLSFSGRSRENPELSSVLAAGVLTASAVMVPRLLVLLGVVQPRLVVPLLPPFSALFLTTLLGAGLTYRLGRREHTEEVKLENPFRLRPALSFAFIFALILLLARAAQEFLGAGGVYLTSALAGLTQLDAIALTLAQGVGGGDLEPQLAVRGLSLAAASNSLLKVGLAFGLGARPFALTLLAVLLLAASGCVAAAWFLPPLDLTLPG